MPGIPKTSSTPCSSSERTTASAPVSVCVESTTGVGTEGDRVPVLPMALDERGQQVTTDRGLEPDQLDAVTLQQRLSASERLAVTHDHAADAIPEDRAPA